MDKPEGLSEPQSEAWDLLELGKSRKEIGEIVGRSKGTVNGWVTMWRRDYGKHLFNKSGKPPEDPSQDPEWHEMRKTQASNLIVTAGQLTERINAMSPSIGTSRVDRGRDGNAQPIVVPGMPAKDVKDMADAIEKLLGTAQLLIGAAPNRRRTG